MNAQEIISLLNLEPLPEEGGFYRETFRDPKMFSDRNASTCIYYLITPEEFSGLHAVKSTEIFHFYAGDRVEMIQINEKGELSSHIMGKDLLRGDRPQVIVEPYVWQGTKLLPGGNWALLGCTVSPGFDFSDFLAGSRTELCKKFPEHGQIITEFTHT